MLREVGYGFPVGLLRHPGVADMGMGMIADSMPLFTNLLKNLWMALGVFTNTKKGCLCLVLAQLLQHPRGYFWNRPVVESEINPFSARGAVLATRPNPLGKKPWQPERNYVQAHWHMEL